MSDPTIQTFCCHHTGKNEDMAVIIMNEFNTNSYNAVCITSSLIGILGAIYQILPRVETMGPSRFHPLSTSRGRQIIIWLAVADLLASAGVLIRSIFWFKYKTIRPLKDDDQSVLFCAITSAWTQYFYTVTWLWTLFYAVDTWLTLRGRDSHPVLYHSVAWGLPAATTSIGLSILYIPNATCHNLDSLSSALLRILPNYFVTYLPIAAVMVANPVIYLLASRSVEMAVALPFAQFTSKERKLVDALRLKFFLINAAFYACWLPNLLNGVLIWTMWFNMPVKVIITIWYIMALMNPMQALLNALVYRRWQAGAQQLRLPAALRWRPRSPLGSERSPLLGSERSPLLGSEPPTLQLGPRPADSINTFATI